MNEPLAHDTDDDVAALRARWARERGARLAAEAIAEKATRELYDRKGDLELLEAVANASNSAKDLRSALKVTVDAVCERSGWPVGHVFLLSRDGRTLVPTGVWHLDDPEHFRGFKRITEASTFTSGVGVPGKVLASRAPIWIKDAKAEPSFPRAQAAEGVGVNAAFAFPILIEDSVLGVVEFFSPVVAEPDDRLLELVAQVGLQLGRVLERDRHTREIARRAEELTHYSTELEQANDELKEFAYVASHDLTEPLRTIAGFVQLLKQRYEGQLDESADEFIGFIVDGTERMQALIEGLLSYSRTGRSELVTSRVDLNDTLNRAIGALAASIAESGAEIEMGELPVISGDPTQLGRLFENLVSNAVKFKSDRAPVVRIGAEFKGGAWHFFVSDNGIGIDERHRERIFNVFERLHGSREYQGTGIGLSICKKVVERHGGRIWVEDTPGGGSTFKFVLPGLEEDG
ncbi:MAG TPA: ATP-binding protein [Solirubrobacterales bacterium]|nr:ATP-binding protein [Solirubrobacterales bacterium]